MCARKEGLGGAAEKLTPVFRMLRGIPVFFENSNAAVTSSALCTSIWNVGWLVRLHLLGGE